jgi:peroxiredoxin
MKIRYNFALLSILALASCADKNTFVLSGEIENPKSLEKVYLLQVDSSSTTLVDSAQLSDQHKFSFKRDAPTAALYKLRVGGSFFDLMAKNGDDIKFKTNAQDTTNAYEITGSEGSEKIKEFNKISNHYAAITSKILADYNYKIKTLNQPQASTFAAAEQEFKKNQAEFSEATLKFMNENKTSLAAFYASTSLDPVPYEKQLIDYADQIDKLFTGNPSVDLFKKHMKEAKPVSLGHPAPVFTINDVQSNPVSLSEYKGKYVLVDFWASWCAPCRKENPNIVKLYAEYKGKGLNILGISLDEHTADWEKAIADDKLTWRHASELKNFGSPVVKAYHVESIPSNFVIGPDGTIVAKNLFGADLAAFLNKTFNQPKG